MKLWSFNIVEEPHYGGNEGYRNEPRSSYRYDSLVQNHKAVQVGDLAFIRVGLTLIGVARIECIEREQGVKPLRRCPICETLKIHARKRKHPTWLCEEGHEFDDPLVSERDVTKYSAVYGRQYEGIRNMLQWDVLKPYFVGNSAHSIREVDAKAFFANAQKPLSEYRERLAKLGGAELETYLGFKIAKMPSKAAQEDSAFRPENGISPTRATTSKTVAGEIHSSNWTGDRTVIERVKCLTEIGPPALAALADWLHYIEYERNDPDVPDGMPSDIIQQLKQLHTEIGELIACASYTPEEITSQKLRAAGLYARKLLKPHIRDGRLFMANFGVYGARIAGGLFALKAVELMTGVYIPIDTGSGATVFAAGVAASTLGNRTTSKSVD